MIAGHQRLISPFLTHDHETGVNYGSICSIYLVRFAVSGAAVALLTRNHVPSGTGTFMRSGAEPEFCMPARTYTIMKRAAAPRDFRAERAQRRALKLTAS